MQRAPLGGQLCLLMRGRTRRGLAVTSGMTPNRKFAKIQKPRRYGSERLASVWKSHPAHELRKSWIGAQFLPAWIEAQPYQPVRPLMQGLIEPGEGGIPLT